MTRRAPGFTLLEVVVAMAILVLALMAIFDLNAGAISMHTYAKKVTVATLLARSKMTDIEQDLYDKGFNVDDEERSGDFTEEGWPSFKWRVKIIAPNTQDVSTDQILSALFNIPMGGGSGDPLSAMASMFGPAASGAAGALGSATGGSSSGLGALAGAGPMAGMAKAQMGQFLDQIRQWVREVHLTVTWKDGKQVESVDVVTHIVSMGPGSDRNGTPTTQQASNNPNDPMVNSRTGTPVPSPMTDSMGRLVDPASPNDVVIPMSQYQAFQQQQRAAAAAGGTPNPSNLPFQGFGGLGRGAIGVPH